MKETLKWSKNIKTFQKLSKSHRLANIRKESLFQGFKMGEILLILNVSRKSVEKRWRHH